ncbi:tannase/feruloyl esterase family alpha/beta hydrolase [Variovorax ginsengisoli]|uniref:Tannase/feruloyl esterase family alpha/beta hydrolase n=1 Tax=Variovorax ginsengisoli TaxID=363844 RepID=A0ABT8SEP1_9BURK|nr:tannase/feruloyl esterase family alpha/beta hydrolase [Variovorax ginsengisoli]MDN8618221.1 tannase/feruloyl esterase family alpha/beta hydrolase [Variovorax ginsengisoli]MDO1537391.1 tannase/feruloyl esterase family alpha/beta hydrolase [Variovorax ginsengisoli]
MVALELQDPTMATTSFVNATGSGAKLYGALTDWVENGNSPDRIDVSAPATPSAPTSTRPLRLYPAKATFIGGNPQAASSYTCA